MSTFDERATTWDTPERQARAEAVAQAIRDSVPLTSATRAIDIGSGTGLLGLALASEVGQMVLAEPSTGMLDVAHQKLAAGGPANVTTAEFDLTTELSAGRAMDGSFDLAISLLVLHHLEDTAAALGAIRRLLLPGGRIALADLDSEDGSFHDPDADGIHHLGFDRVALARLAGDAGFVDLQFRTATSMEHDGRSYPLFLMTGRRP